MKRKPASSPEPIADSAQALGTAMGGMWKSMAELTLPSQALSDLQGNYLKQATELWNQTLARLQPESENAKAVAPPAPITDKRFAAPEWAANPATAYTAQMYLLNARTLMQMADSMQGDEKARARVRFAVQQWVDAMSPANFMALNPEAQRKALDSKGESVTAGLTHLWNDLRKGTVSQTDESVFEVGRNVATSVGSVVFENELFQLIEYKPLTPTVHQRPMLFVPPCINKFYILDLQPENSLIRYTVEQGHRVFVMSWRNPDESMAGLGWDDYIEQGPIKAIEVVSAITGQERFNMLGFCVGGTLIATALAVLGARGKQPAHSLTLLTTLLDFAHTGVLDVFVDESSVQMREVTIGADAPNGPGLMKGKDLATTFSFLRPNDLVWNYVVGNYLKGEAPPPFDLLYWNGDSTNLPGPMYCWYLRHTYLQNDLCEPNKLTVCGQQIDLGRIDVPLYIYGSREDHIVPWLAAYASTRLFNGKRRFVLGASGHIAGVINPASKNKRNHWVNDRLPASADEWFSSATEKPGSWWPDWAAWLKTQGGPRVTAPKTTAIKKFKPIEPAPGRYVKQKA
jgi:polyhydroxyalkanoate synthase